MSESTEQWGPVEGWPYEVSSRGRIRRTEAPHGRTWAGRLMKPSVTDRGYFRVCLRGDGGRRSYFVHQLVALSFVDGYDDGLVVNHKNGDPGDNRATNLEWVTRKENNRHAREDTGAWYPAIGEESGGAKLNEADIRAIRMSNEKQQALAERYGVDQSAISLIVNRKTWRHVA